MDYEQKYKEALQKIRELIERGKENGWTIISYEKDFEDIFPELKESEGERILEIIKHCIESRYLHTSTIKGISQKECFAWLEKQGETYTKRDVDDAYLKGVCDAKQELEKQGGIDNCPLESSTNTVMADSKKNQVEPNPYSGTSFEYNGHIWGMCARDGGAEVSMDGNLKAFISSDASFIYPDIPQPNLAPKSALEEFKEEKVDNANKNEQILANSAKTCKKSQRMISAEAKEALYDKPATIDIDKMIDDYANNRERGNEEFGKPLNCMIRAYRQGLKDAIGKVVSESAWSEEDEEMLDGIILRCEKYGHQEQINWLKSLKQRIGG